MAGPTLPERVAQIYYTYGLFCSSYPTTAITFALSVILLCCYPLLNVPLPGNTPTVVHMPLGGDSDQNIPTGEPMYLDILHNETQKLPYVWVKDKPLLYIHQIVMRVGVSPWNSNLKMWDAFRAPLQEIFRLLETIRNHEETESKGTLLQHCYQIGGIKRRDSKASLERVLPEYSCLVLSPANIWQQNLQSFSLDANIVNTVHKYQNLQKGKSSIAEMAFGMHLRDTGIKRYPLRSRPRVLQYAVTIFYQNADRRFISSLTNKLREMYPLYQESQQPPPGATLIYYPGQFNYHELVPLMITFVGLFLYVYFSVRKIEFIKSKFGLAACSVVTIAGSLSMSMGICFYFGFSLSLQGKEIFPYLVIIVGLENILVLTKSVTSTDSRLDVKIRLAQGLSKEGWSITKNLLTEITILTVSFFTFVPFIQEFSIFMIVSLISDYFIQMVFFATILGIDVGRMEFYTEQNHKLHLKEYFNSSWRYEEPARRITKSRSHPRLNGLAHASPADVVAQRGPRPGGPDTRLPKRIRLVNMWARTRFFQRAFMVWMLVWISMIIYNSGVVEYFIVNVDKVESTAENGKKNEKSEQKLPEYTMYNASGRHPFVFSPLLEVEDTEKTVLDANDTIFLKHSPHYWPSSRLGPAHWSAILSQYNESLAGRYVVVLPAALLSHRVSPELAAALRHADERDPPPLRWQALAAALDPLDILPEFEVSDGAGQPYQWGKSSELPIYPTTPMEILLLAILCIISVAVIAYMMVVLYRCVCSRHYAEWRASWSEDADYRKMIAKQPAVQLVMEAVPIVVSGHNHEVECIVTDGEKVVSSCLQGTVKVWDSLNGDIINTIDREAYFKLRTMVIQKLRQRAPAEESQAAAADNNNCRDFATRQITQTNAGRTHKTSTFQPVPRLRKRLISHLSGLQFRNSGRDTSAGLSPSDTTKYDFAKSYRELYSTEPHDDGCDSKEHSSNKVELGGKRVEASEDGGGVLSCRTDSAENDSGGVCEGAEWRQRALAAAPIWCMDFCHDLVILGCADGRLEFWEASTARLMCVWWFPGGGAGVTHVRALAGGRRVLAAALCGRLALLRLDARDQRSGAHLDWRFRTAHRRTHKRSGSADLQCAAPGRRGARLSYDAGGDSEAGVRARGALPAAPAAHHRAARGGRPRAHRRTGPRPQGADERRAGAAVDAARPLRPHHQLLHRPRHSHRRSQRQPGWAVVRVGPTHRRVRVQHAGARRRGDGAGAHRLVRGLRRHRPAALRVGPLPGTHAHLRAHRAGVPGAAAAADALAAGGGRPRRRHGHRPQQRTRAAAGALRRRRRLRAGAPDPAAQGRHRVRLRQPAADRPLPARLQTGNEMRLDLTILSIVGQSAASSKRSVYRILNQCRALEDIRATQTRCCT